VRQAQLDEANSRDEQQLERALEVVGRQLRRRLGRRPAGVPDRDVDAAERVERSLHEPLQVGRVGHVPADGERADPLGVELELLAAAGEHRDVRALVGERLGRSEAEPRRRSADDRRPAAQTEIH
jgi:hypothetical protein